MKRWLLAVALLFGALAASNVPSQATPLGASAQAGQAAPVAASQVQYRRYGYGYRYRPVYYYPRYRYYGYRPVYYYPQYRYYRPVYYRPAYYYPQYRYYRRW